MKFYYLSAITNNEGDFEIHHRECPRIPSFHDRIYLGPFNNDQEAINQAVKVNAKSIICITCQSASMVPKFSHFTDSDSRQSNP
jgi:hypothetical protein